jgi:hypothetical protein
VWIQEINRYVQLKEPAFHVFELWTKGISRQEIILKCCNRYSISEDESKQFVEEITGLIESLCDSSRVNPKTPHTVSKLVEANNYLSEHYYQIGNQCFRFVYRNQYLEELFHPLFIHQEITELKSGYVHFEIFSNGEQDAFVVNDSPAQYFRVDDIDAFQGAVLMEILNIIHGMQINDWMAVFHASAVTDGQSAILFTAPSGSGKSSIALLMMADGYDMLSDDFVAMSLQKTEIYHLPSGISVKSGSVKFMGKHLPQKEFHPISEGHEFEHYLPPLSKQGLLASVPIIAIVFVNYNPEVEFNLKKESNLRVMDQLIKQSWIATTPEAAECFLGWYFKLPVYSLQYSDNRKVVEEMKKLFG